jgi:hypothetical protein
MTDTAYYSVIVDRPEADVWDLVRDFNSYPIWVPGVDDSYIEDDLSGTAVGAVRNFAIAGERVRQRLVSHSDVERFFTYESCAPVEIEESGTARTMSSYRGTLRLRPVVDGGRCLAEWSAEYECSHPDVEYWAQWWAAMLPTWLANLRDHVAGQPRNPFGVQDVPDPDGADLFAFADTVGLTGSADDDNAEPWDAHADAGVMSLEGNWSSRWNAEGFDWQTGRGRLEVTGDRVFILFDWDQATKHGLIEARSDGQDRLIGRYLNLSAPEITQPWVGLIVDVTRIDGEHGGGRIDFRR